MYSITSIVEGIKYSVYFFASFSGHFHPFTPVKPLTIDEAYNSKERTFYLAWYSESKEGLRLDFFEKYWLQFDEIDEIDNINKPEGIYYFEVELKEGGYVVGNEISARATIDGHIFYKYIVNKNGKAIESFIVRKKLIDKYIYTYKPSGVLDDTEIILNDIPE